MLIMPEASLEVTRHRTEEIRQGVARLQVSHQGQLLEGITISAGVAVFPDHGHAGEEVLQAADKALYRAKAEGRNRTVAADE